MSLRSGLTITMDESVSSDKLLDLTLHSVRISELQP